MKFLNSFRKCSQVLKTVSIFINTAVYLFIFLFCRANPAFMSPTDNFFSPCSRKLVSKRGLHHPSLIALYVFSDFFSCGIAIFVDYFLRLCGVLPSSAPPPAWKVSKGDGREDWEEGGVSTSLFPFHVFPSLLLPLFIPALSYRLLNPLAMLASSCSLTLISA